MSLVELAGWTVIVFVVCPVVGVALGTWINRKIGGDRQ